MYMGRRNFAVLKLNMILSGKFQSRFKKIISVSNVIYFSIIKLYLFSKYSYKMDKYICIDFVVVSIIKWHKKDHTYFTSCESHSSLFSFSHDACIQKENFHILLNLIKKSFE